MKILSATKLKTAKNPYKKLPILQVKPKLNVYKVSRGRGIK